MSPPCRYFAAGACRNGAACPFSHDTAVANALAAPCVYYARGHCQYGDRCMYDHVRPAAGGPPSAAAPPAPPAPSSFVVPPPPAVPAWTGDAALAYVDEDEEEVLAELEALGLLSPDDGGDGADDVARAVAAIDDGHAAGPHDASTPLCGPFTATGACARGDACRRVHGAACERCGKHALHPLNPADAAAHDAECAARAARIAELASSADVECGVCLEVVLSKPRVGDRRFGLLTGCDHAFCLACIRSWRGHADGGGGGLDVDGAVRACPLCRSPSAFVTPSATWPATPEAKAAVIEGYKTALSSIECRHWARGRGVCPFGTSCHYRHVDADGREVDRSAGLRFVGDAEGSVRPMAGVRLSDFLAAGSVGARRALGR